MTYAAKGLAALEAQLQQDLEFLELPAKPWVPERSYQSERVRDVVVIGAGMCGLAALAKLQFTGISNVVAYDAAPAGLEGPWITFARMETLRSPKTLHGPALGLAQLTFRAWFTAQWGNEAWQELDKIPKAQWMDYLVWYRRVLNLPVPKPAVYTPAVWCWPPGVQGSAVLPCRNSCKALTAGSGRTPPMTSILQRYRANALR